MKSALISALNLTCTFGGKSLSDCGRFEREGLIFHSVIGNRRFFNKSQLA